VNLAQIIGRNGIWQLEVAQAIRDGDIWSFGFDRFRELPGEDTIENRNKSRLRWVKVFGGFNSNLS
jgi:hypothetical protein